MSLEGVYYEINQILGNNAEPLESVRLVETYRRYLKPETVRPIRNLSRSWSLPPPQHLN